MKPLFLAGQTASGKTAVALELARRLAPVEIVNADAFQVYRGLATLTAAPSAAEQALCPHHLFGELHPDEECDAATLARRAGAVIAETSRRALPLVVSGSGLYLKAITHGLAPTPKADPVLRTELDRLSLEDLVERYRRADPAGAEKTNLKNRRYVTRNLEITVLAGRPASEIKSEWAENRPELHAVYLQRSRDDIYARIDARTRAMFDAGVVEEVAALGPVSTTAAKTIGLREIREMIDGNLSREDCIAAIQQATRRYAKRQETWFRREREFVPVPVGPEDSAGDIADAILERIPLPP